MVSLYKDLCLLYKNVFIASARLPKIYSGTLNLAQIESDQCLLLVKITLL